MKIKYYLPLLLLLLLTAAQECDEGAIRLNQRCVKCRDILNTAEISMASTLANNKCSCKLGFVWMGQEAECRSISIQKISRFSILAKQLTSTNNILQEQPASRFLQTVTCNKQNGFIPYRMIYYQNSNPTVCYNCRLIPYGLNAANGSKCSCQSGFDYYSPWTTCYCYKGSYIDTHIGRCLSCASMGNYLTQCTNCAWPFGRTILGCVYMPNQPNVANGTCATGYEFSFIAYSCVCDYYKDFSINSAGKCTSCPQGDFNCINCKNSYVYDGFQCIHGSFIANFDFNTAFACKTGYAFKKNPFTSQIVSCACSAAAKYYQNGANCISCSTPPSGVAVASCQSCLDSAKFYKGSEECIYCPGVFLALGTATANGCDCPANYFWNANTDRCECDFALGFIGGAISNCINCKNIANIDNLILPNACSCLPGFKWNPQTKTCDCDSTSPSVFTLGQDCINCASMIGSTQAISDNKMSCLCIFGYFWNPALKRCVCDHTKNYAIANGLCTDCKQAVMSNGLANNFGCVCTNGFIWNMPSGRCLCPAGSVIMGNKCITCATASLPAGATVNDCLACNSSKGYASHSMGCFACAFQQGANSAVANGVCTCSGVGTVWRPSLGACACDWSQLYYSRLNVAGGFSCSLCSFALNNPSWCTCDSSYRIFDLKNNICTDASADPNGSGSYITFSCKSGYFWSQSALPYRCISGFAAFVGYFSSSTSQSLACSSSSNVGVCNICDTASGYLFISGTNQCLLCSTVSGSNGSATSNSCGCNSGLWWNGITLACDASKCSSGAVYNPSSKTCACDPITQVQVNSACISCASIKNSNGIAASADSCGCISPNLWVASSSGLACTTSQCNPATQLTIGNSCFTCPSGSGFGTGAVNGSGCGCIPNYVWLSTQAGARCACDLSKAYFSASSCIPCPLGTKGGDGKGGCICSGLNIWQKTTCVSCSAAANVVSLSNGACFTCGTAGTFTGSKISSSACACVPTSLKWNTTGSCDCGPTSATIISGTTFTCFACSNASAFTSGKATSTSCTCVSASLQWNPSRSVCDCGSQPNTIIFGSGSAAKCITCIRSIFMVGASAALNTCVCFGKLVWNSVNNTCGCSNNQAMIIIGNRFTAQCINCSTIPFGSTVADSTSCKCLGTGLIFDSSLGICACPAGSIILPNFTCAACPASSSFYTPYECLCPQGSIWSSSNVCLQCGSSSIPNSVPFLGTNFACVCTTGFIWDVMTLSCISSTACTTATASCMKCPGGAKAISFASAKTKNLVGGAAVQILENGTFTNYNQIRNFMCPCSTGLTWDSFRLGCYANGLQ